MNIRIVWIPSLPIPGQNHGKYVDHSLVDKHLYSVCFMFSKKGERSLEKKLEFHVEAVVFSLLALQCVTGDGEAFTSNLTR